MPHRLGFSLAALLLIGAAGRLLATPGTPTITSPSSASGATYNTRPWIYFNSVDASLHTINNIQIQIASDATFLTMLYDKTNSPLAADQLTFYPVPAASGATIRHRVQTALTTGTRYVRVRVWCDQAILSGWSATTTITINAASWTDPTITAASTLIRKPHIDELRTAINNLRSFRASGAYAWTDATVTAGSTLIRKVHMDDLRAALNTPYSSATGSTPVYTDATITAGATLIRKVHLDELRANVLWP